MNAINAINATNSMNSTNAINAKLMLYYKINLYKGVIMTVTTKKSHYYITRKKGVCGGRSIIRGTRIPVWSIIKWYKIGMSIEEILREFHSLHRPKFMMPSHITMIIKKR